VAIMAGSAVITESWRDKVAAILLLGYPGQEGGHAFADVLLGHVSPSGKLPFTMPRRAEDLPFFDKDATKITYDLWHGYRARQRDAGVSVWLRTELHHFQAERPSSRSGQDRDGWQRGGDRRNHQHR
jgi:hypothetical protein